MVLLKLQQYETDQTGKQIATKWEISTDKDFTDIIKTERVTENLYSYICDLTIPDNVTYFARVYREYENNNESYQTDPVAIYSNHNNVINVVTNSDITIDTPIVDAIITENTNLTITSSKFRGKGDGHHSTSWIITDEQGDVLWSSLEDKTNLEMIKLNNFNDINKLPELFIYVIHRSGNDIESLPGKKVLVTSNHNYKITSSLTDVEPMLGYTLKVEPKSGSDTGIVKVDFLTTDNKLLLSVTPDQNQTENNYIIPVTYLSYNKYYYIDIYAKDNLNRTTSRRVSLNTKSGHVNTIIDKDFIYSDTLDIGVNNNDVVKNILTTLENKKTFFSTNYLPSSAFLLPNYHTGLTYGYINSDNIDTDDLNDLVLTLDTTDPGMNVLVTYDDLVVIDMFYRDESGRHPTFFIFKYIRSTQRFMLIGYVKRKDENTTTSKTNAILQMSRDTFHYVSSSGKIRCLNTTTKTITDVVTLPDNFKNAKMVKINTAGYLLIGSVGITKIYDIEQNSFTDGSSLPLKRFVNFDLRTQQLSNGDSLIIKLAKDKDADVDYNIIRYDFKENKFKVVEGSENILYPRCYILTEDKKLFMCYKENNENKKIVYI